MSFLGMIGYTYSSKWPMFLRWGRVDGFRVRPPRHAGVGLQPGRRWRARRQLFRGRWARRAAGAECRSSAGCAQTRLQQPLPSLNFALEAAPLFLIHHRAYQACVRLRLFPGLDSAKAPPLSAPSLLRRPRPAFGLEDRRLFIALRPIDIAMARANRVRAVVCGLVVLLAAGRSRARCNTIACTLWAA